ncbi:hypothetical protein LTR27_005046 [Elasticomyces elasticus]|nr:hypothetical protein LTR27_005046 [Elasticomyces elasticus]
MVRTAGAEASSSVDQICSRDCKEDEKLATSVMGLMGSQGYGKEWMDISHAYLRWARFGGSETKERWFNDQYRFQKKLDAGLAELQKQDLNAMPEDGGEAIRAPDDL